MRFFVTGHSGFKGTWLTEMLLQMGHEVIGYSSQIENGSMYQLNNLEERITKQYIEDIRDLDKLILAVEETEPDYLIHLAAQSLVHFSYENPEITYTTNVSGTLNTLIAGSLNKKIRKILLVTTDKVYAENILNEYFTEDHAIGGGRDPYSRSKAMADLLSQLWAQKELENRLIIARAGNVIGGGDWSKDRLLSDAFRAINGKTKLLVRNPKAVRPWQHVLDCIYSYLILLSDLNNVTRTKQIWNIGPEKEDHKTVIELLEELRKYNYFDYEIDENYQKVYESKILNLDCSKFKSNMNWSSILKFSESVNWTCEWNTKFVNGGITAAITKTQIDDFLKLANLEFRF